MRISAAACGCEALLLLMTLALASLCGSVTHGHGQLHQQSDRQTDQQTDLQNDQQNDQQSDKQSDKQSDEHSDQHSDRQSDQQKYACLSSAVAGCKNGGSPAASCHSCADAGLKRCGLDVESAYRLGVCYPELRASLHRQLVASAAPASEQLRCLAGRLLECGSGVAELLAAPGGNLRACQRCVSDSFRECRASPLDSFRAGLCSSEIQYAGVSR